MNKYMFVCIILICVQGSASAGITDPLEVGGEMVAWGIEQSMINIADDIMDFVCDSDEEYNSDGADVAEGDEIAQEITNINDSSTCHGETTDGEFTFKESVTDAIIGFASWQVKPFTYPTVLAMMGITLAFAIGFITAYIFLGAVNTMISNNSSDKYSAIKGIIGSGSSDNSFENYGQNVLTGLLAMVFSVAFIYITLEFSQAIKLMMMESIAESISPSMASVTILYLSMAIMWLCLSIFFGISNIVICLTAAGSFAIGALYTSDRTRHITMWVVKYFIGLVLMQVLVIATVVIVVGIMMDAKTGTYGALLIAVPNAEISIYAGMVLLLIWMCQKFVRGKVDIIKYGSKVLRMVV